MNNTIETKKVPELRFPEFEDEWNKFFLKDISNKVTDGTHNTPKIKRNGVPFITAIHVKDGFIDFDNSYYLSKKDHEIIFNRCNPEFGDLLMVNIGAGTATVARVNVDYEFSLKNVALIKPNYNLIDSYFLSQIQREKSKRLIHQLASGGAQPFLSLKAIKKLKLTIPSLPEQQKIADFLSQVDKKIELLSQKEAALREYKKGVMQKLFSQEIRFKIKNAAGELVEPPDWEEKRLGDIAKISTGNSNRSSSNLDSRYTFFDRSVDVRKSDIYLFDSEAIIVAGEGQEFIPKYFKGKFDLHQRTYAIMDFKNDNGKFLYYFIHKKKNYFLSQAVGSTVKSLRMPIFNKMKISLPCIEEQTKIANFLSRIDDKIETVAERSRSHRQWKKGLLQKMFV